MSSDGRTRDTDARNRVERRAALLRDRVRSAARITARTSDADCTVLRWHPKALQNTGRTEFRQPRFLDTRYTRGYSSWFLTGTYSFARFLTGPGA